MDKEYIYSSNDEPILTIEEQAIIVEWTRNNYKTFMSSGYNRQMQVFDYYDHDYVPSCIWDIKKRIMDKEDLHGFKQEPLFRDAIGYMTDGGQLHEHTDPNPRFSNLIHTRFNVMISKPVAGGVPVQNGKEIRVEEGDVWRCDAGIYKHSCTEVQGNKPRIVCSFGFLL
jgi:hypothetical protein